MVHVTSFVPALVMTSGLPVTRRKQRRGVDIVQDSVWSIYPKGFPFPPCVLFKIAARSPTDLKHSRPKLACHDRQVAGGGRNTPVRALGHAVVTATALG